MSNQNKNQLNLPGILDEVKKQKKYIEELKKGGDKAFALVVADAFVNGMRDSGYKSTATAIDEFVDNAIQAGAKMIHIQRFDNPQKKYSEVAIFDDGHGMEPDMIRAAILWGGTHRYNSRTLFGRYGFGLPSAAVSITTSYEVYSKVEEGDWYKVRVNLKEIADGKLTNENGLVVAPKAEKTDIPNHILEVMGKKDVKRGTIIRLINPDRWATGFNRLSSFERKMKEHLGLIYRGLLDRINIMVNGDKVEMIDPLFLDPRCRFYDIGNSILAEGFQEPLEFEVKTSNDQEAGTVRMRFSYMHPKFQRDSIHKLHKGRHSIMKENNAYFIVSRAGRQIDLIKNPNYTKDSDNITIVNHDWNWAIELDFDPILDEEFGITVNKQQVNISDRMWQILDDKDVPLIVKSMRKRFKSDTSDLDAQRSEESEESKVSEAILAEEEKSRSAIDKAKSTEKVNSPRAKEKFNQDAQKEAEESGRPIEEILEEKSKKIESRPYVLEFEALEGAPFYRVEQYFTQKRLFLNTRHRFYTDIYNSPDSTSRLKAALELLLFVIGTRELEFLGEEMEEFYKNERITWSMRLSKILAKLDQIEPIQDAASAKQEELELTA